MLRGAAALYRPKCMSFAPSVSSSVGLVLVLVLLLNVLRNFTTTPTLSAGKQKEGKKKQVMKRTVERERIVKSTALTTKKFRDAVSVLNFEKTAAPLNGIADFSSKLDVGTVTKFSKPTEEKLHHLKAFKKYQHHERFRHPTSIISGNTKKLNETFVQNLDQNSKFNRVYLDGPKGCGKSTLVNQTIAGALEKFNNDVVILHLYSAEIIGNGTSDYVRNNRLGLWQQPMATKRWLYRTFQTNAEVFKKMKLTKDVRFVSNKIEHSMKAGDSLHDYVLKNREMKDGLPNNAFQFFIQQLIDNSSKIPVVLSVDDFNAMADCGTTPYFTPDYVPIKIQEFELADTILKFASGELNFEKGGVLLAKSSDFHPKRKTTHIAVYPEEEYDAYMKPPRLDLELSQRLALNGGIKPFKVQGLSKEETHSLLSFWRDQEVLLVREDFRKPDYGNDAEAKAAARRAIFDSEKQFDKLVQSNFIVTQGNPHGLVKNLMLSY